MAPSLAGRVAWITGAGSGIGRASGLALARAGAVVVLSGRRAEPLSAAAAEAAEGSGTAVVEPLDIADPAEARAVVDRIVARFGRLDLYVGAAGYNIPQRRWADLPAESANALIATNLSGAFNAASAALAPMRAAGDGVLIHIGSWSGKRVAVYSGPAYTAAKAGLIAMNESLNLEVALEGIRSTVISPGGVDTPLLDQLPTPPAAEARARLLQPEDCADLVLYVAGLPRHVRIDEIMVTPTIQTG
ncbi:Short-chain dehydrogenase/reductase SDR [Sphingobium herbicidovorans NBRC 16415]|uniref:Short-chain dehydrogenase/reductase SDR n=1 Tax=Sphingobium herbicidovorans (strain ATCC 700291 / DSM 11019 / CCUG 56400 / KCTC 2939 / LMG 18315 / NBRC 16415 / MH) TaxID=1219045 RepID=A0A086PA88_SPHHM|nr:SDR family NAD(P)-dependent oxidoreductase [Sphingobium herbicidovorans]KFG90306.1 Short-chain dehydrogenase/reductase SDR [Sphingobium herbicidovorans NBRC 16415]